MASSPWSGGMTRYSPQLARSSQPFRRRDSITLSAALALAPSSLIISGRSTSRRFCSARVSTTLLSCGDKVRTVKPMIVFLTEPPDFWGFDEQDSIQAPCVSIFVCLNLLSGGGYVTQNILLLRQPLRRDS